MNMKRDFHNPPQRRVPASLGTLLALLLLSACGSWFADDKESSLDGECVGKDYNALNDLIAAPFQNCNDSSECPSGSYCESDSNVHHTAASGAICYWQCYSDSDCGFGNHCDCNGLCEVLDGDAGPGVDPSCPRSEGLLASIEPGVHYESVGAASEWQMQETVAPVMDTVGTGCSFSNLTTGGVPGATINSYGILGLEADGLEGRLAWSVPNGGSLSWRGPQSYLECDQSTSLDLDGTSKAVRIAFRIPNTTTLSYIGSWQHAKTLAGKRDGLDAIDPSQGSGWDISFNELNAIRVVLFDGSGTIDIRTTPTAVTLSGGNYNDGEWHFVEMVVDYSGAQPTLRARSDLDTGYEVSIDPTWNLSNSAPFRIGSFPSADSGAPRNMQVTYVSTYVGTGAEAMVNLSTPDNTFWDSAEPSNGRSCTYNEDCPYGSKCNDDTKLCSYSCLGTDHAIKGCTGAQVCDCFGDCVEPGTTPVRQNIDMPFMEVMPRDIPVANEVFLPRRVSVNLVTEVPAVALASTTIPVTVTAPPGIEVSCDATGRTNGVYGQSCTLNSWSFSVDGQEQRAGGELWVRGIAGSTSEEPQWTLRLTSGSTAIHVVYITVKRHDFDPMQTAPADFTPDFLASGYGYFEGTLNRAAIGDLGSNRIDAPIPAAVPVKAWANEFIIDFYDETHSISPSGWLRVDTEEQPWQEILRLPESPLPTATGILSSSTRNDTRSYSPSSGTLSGGFSLDHVGSSHWEYSLAKSSDPEVCASNSDCAFGESCAAEFAACLPSPGWVAGQEPVSRLMSADRAERWISTIGGLIESFVGKESYYPSNISVFIPGGSEYVPRYFTDSQYGIYNKGTGVTRDDPEGVPLLGRGVLANTPSSEGFGKYLANDFIALFSQYPYDANIGIYLKRYSPVCPLLVGARRPEPGCMIGASDELYRKLNLYWFVPVAQAFQDNYVPCHVSEPDTNTFGHLSTLTAKQEWESQEGRYTCAEFYENSRVNSNNAQFPSTEDAWVNSECFETDLDVTFYSVSQLAPHITGNGEENHRIYLCPFKPALFGKDRVVNAEMDMCFKPSDSNVPRTLSQRFNTVASGYSKEFICEDGAFPAGVDIASYADRSNDSSIGDLLVSCLSELSQEPPALFPDVGHELGDSSITQQNLETLFSSQECFSPANFYSALYELTEGLDAPATWDPVGGWGDQLDGPDVQRYLTMLLRQWTQLHTFVSREGAQVATMASALRLRSDLGVQEQNAVDTAPTYESLLDEAERGWQLLLNYDRVVRNFRDEDALLNPDYRQLPNDDTEDQNIGLPVFVMEGLAAHLKLVTRYTKNTGLTVAGLCSNGAPTSSTNETIARTQRALHYTNLVSETWGAMVAASVATPTWQTRWQDALGEYHVERLRVVEELRQLSDCAEGGTSNEIPLFFGDVTGTSSQYFAASDYLLTGWAAPAVQSAITALSQARNAFLSARNSELQDELSASDASRRLDDIASTFGRQLQDMCGLVEIPSLDVLNRMDIGDGQGTLSSEGQPIALSQCFIDTSNPSCVRSSEPSSVDSHVVRGGQLTENQVQFELCRSDFLLQGIGAFLPTENPGEFESLRSGLQNLADQLTGQAYDQVVLIPTANANGYFVGDTTGNPIYNATFFDLRRKSTELALASGESARDLLEFASATCSSDHFAGNDFGISQPTFDPLPTECYRGVLGEHVAAMMTTAIEMEISLAQMEASEATVRQQEESCELTYINASENTEMFDRYRIARDARMEKLAAAKNASGFFGSGIGGMIANGLGALDTVLNGLGLPTDYVGLLSNMGSAAIERENDYEQLAYQSALQESQAQDNARACMVNAGLQRNSFKAAELAIDAAEQRFKNSFLSFQNQRRLAFRLVSEGRAALRREQGRFVPSYAHHYWLDERIDSFERDFIYAQRLVIMALRAVEYEFQQSLDLRQDVIESVSPEDLQDVILALRQEQITRTINSRRPEESQLVLSLRDQILQITSNDDVPVGERDWTPTQKFVDRLWDSENAIFDSKGEYLGQGINFNLAPDGALDYRCGERLWGLTATIQGDLLDVDAPNTSLFLIRRNSFGSQWCDERGDGSLMQVGSMQPTSSLFEDDERGGTEAFGLTKITAMLQPWFNVPRSEFYKESYSEGASEEFAGRGLYGEYTILFPWKGLLEDGFPLERVEDILIRFDYISVDNLTNL